MKVETVLEQLFFTTVRLATTGPMGQSGTGTGFIFDYEDSAGRTRWLVTNRHVVEGATGCEFFFNRSDDTAPLLGQQFTIHVTDMPAVWHFHRENDVDVAVMPFVGILEELSAKQVEIFYRAIPGSMIPTQEQTDQLDAIEEVLFIGYPNGMFDARNLLPIARRGLTATPLQVDYEGRPLFLVDGSVFPGSSGSPVVIANQGSYRTRQGMTIGSRMYLLGLMAQVAFRETEGEIEFVAVPSPALPRLRTREMIDLGVVFKARTIVETVQDAIRRLEPQPEPPPDPEMTGAEASDAP